MENIKFVTSHELTKAHIKKWNSPWFKRPDNFKWWIPYVMWILFGAFGVAEIALSIATGDENMIALGCLLVLSTIALFIFKATIPSMIYKKSCVFMENGKLIRTCTFGNDIEISTGTTTNRYSYDKIKYFASYNEYFIIYFEANRTAIVEKNTFIFGESEQFAEFINEKTQGLGQLVSKGKLNFPSTKTIIAILLIVVCLAYIAQSTLNI